MQSELLFEWKYLFIMSSYKFELKYEDVLNFFTLIRIFLLTEEAFHYTQQVIGQTIVLGN